MSYTKIVETKPGKDRTRMDPNANLKEQLELSARILNMRCVSDSDAEEHGLMAERLAELVEALAGWLESGGFLPDRWRARGSKGAAQAAVLAAVDALLTNDDGTQVQAVIDAGLELRRVR